MASNPPKPQAPTGDMLDPAFIALSAIQKLQACHRGASKLREMNACGAEEKFAAASVEKAKQSTRKVGLASSAPASQG